MTDLIAGQLTDVFRIGLLIALFFTTLRNRAATGFVVPLLAGAVFVAAVIPAGMGGGAPFLPAFAAGLVSNALLLAAIAGLWRIAQQFRA